MKSKLKYRGIITDCLNVMPRRKTNFYESYLEAYEATEKLCKRTMKNRGDIKVLDNEGYPY